MAVFGITDSQYVFLAPNIDLNYLRSQETADGTTFEELIPLLNAPIAAFNRTVPPEMAALMAPPTIKINVQTKGAGRAEVNRLAEYDVERGQRPPKGFAHMLAIWANTAALEYTEEGLRDMTATEVVDHVETLLNGFRYQNLRDMYARLFDPSEVPVDPDPSKTTATSPGFAGSGTGNNAFQATFDPKMKPLPQPYSHYWACEDADLAAALKDMIEQHRRWFPTGPLEFTGSRAMVDLIKSLGEAGGFVRAERALVREPSTNAVATVNGDIYVGVFDDTLRIKQPVDDWEDLNGYLNQPLGNLNLRNPLVIRYAQKWGRGVYLRSKGNYPLERSILIQRGGWNVNNRVGVQLLRVDPSATYAPPDDMDAQGG